MNNVPVATVTRKEARTALFLVSLFHEVHGNWVNKTQTLINEGNILTALQRIKKAKDEKPRRT